MYGKVKWFNKKCGYGFIASDNGQEYFAHWSEIRTIGAELTKGYVVEFEPSTDERGRLSAKQVYLA